jgi:hypothetical protein
LTAHKITIAYHGSTPVPDGMLAHARLSCAHKLPKHPLYSTRLHLAGLSSASLAGFPRLTWTNSASALAPIGEPAPLKIHR